MCEDCGDRLHLRDSSRRGLLKAAGLGLAAAPILATASARAQDAVAAGAGPYATRAYGAASADSGFKPIQIERRELRPQDVLIDVMYCGVCHSDIHTVHGDWGAPSYPSVPGHEIIGRVAAIGKDVTKFRVGDVAGVGCMVASCGECENCLADREQNCLKGATFTYGSEDKVSGGYTFGGYAERLVVTEHFAIRMPQMGNHAAMAPLLCAGITTFSPMQHWQLKPGQRVGVIGMGGLGHIAVKLAVARKAEVTVFTTTPNKLEGARRMGATDAVLWDDAEAMARHANSLDLAISTVPVGYDMRPFMNLLRLDATLVNVGALGDLQGLNGMAQGFGRKSLAGSMIGGIAETQEVVDYCGARNINADIELITPDQIDRAWERVMTKDVRYRFVIDFTRTRQG